MPSESPQYYYINGKISTCRRCKRKRTLDEQPEHLQFKTCYRCRMIERDQKKINQSKRPGALSPSPQSAPPSLTDGPKPYMESRSHSHGHSHGHDKSTHRNGSIGLGSQRSSANDRAAAAAAAASRTGRGLDIAAILGPLGSANAFRVPEETTLLPDASLETFAPELTVPAPRQLKGGAASVNGVNGGANNGYMPSRTPQNQHSFRQRGSLKPEKPSGFAPFKVSKIDPRTLSPQKRHRLQNSFLAVLRRDQKDIGSLHYKPVDLQQTQCLNCGRILGKRDLNKQLCEGCSGLESVIHDKFDTYLTVLQLNRSSDMYKVFFVTREPVDKLLKSSLTTGRSGANILTALYDKYVKPINEYTGAEFIFMNPAQTLDPTTGQPTKSSVIRRFLRCARDNESRKPIVDENFENFDPVLFGTDTEADPEEQLKLDLRGRDTALECCSSLMSLSYDTTRGDLVLCFSHRPHRH